MYLKQYRTGHSVVTTEGFMKSVATNREFIELNVRIDGLRARLMLGGRANSELAKISECILDAIREHCD